MNFEEMLQVLAELLASMSKDEFYNEMQFIMKGENLLLGILFQQGGSSTPGQLAQILNVSPARLSAIMKSLEKKGYINKKENESDKRSFTVEISQSGQELIVEKRRDILFKAYEMLENLGEEDTSELIRILKKIVKFENEANTSVSYENS